MGWLVATTPAQTDEAVYLEVNGGQKEAIKDAVSSVETNTRESCMI